jgi:hypothetical protein
MSFTAPSILEIIESGRWRRAVFTSFTLSLTYFECYILPRLRAQGCSSIDIYVDQLGYRDSLVESRSRHSGRDYTVHPVVVKGGIFHPKLTYLWSEDSTEDVLLVGSGNLTYSGHGGGLEVFEILQPMLHARALAQAAAFFDQLARGIKRVKIINVQPLVELEKRIAGIAVRYPNVEPVDFIHSLGKSGLAQLTEKLAGQDFEQLLVMSPYHTPDGALLKQLVDATQPDALLVAVDQHKGTSPFPFHETRSWSCKVGAVAAIDSKKRSIHAKWYEWRAADYVITFTGSFNATTESLGTVKNVECGVLRRMREASEEWEEADIPPFKQQVFPRNGVTGELLATALLKGRALEGRILGYTAAMTTEWSFTLHGGDRETTPLQCLNVAPDGTFAAMLNVKVDITDDSAIQITMECEEQSARGWVALPHILAIPPQRRAILSTLANVERGAENADDFAGLVTIVMSEIERLNAATQSTLNSSKAEQKRLPSALQPAPPMAADRGVEPRSAVHADGTFQSSNARERIVKMIAEGDKGWAVLELLGKILLGVSSMRHDQEPPGPAGPKNKGPSQPIVLVDDEGEDEDESASDRTAKEKERKRLEKAMEEFEKKIGRWRNELNRRILILGSNSSDVDGAMANLASLESTWLHVILRACVGPLHDIERAHFELEEWIHRIVYTRFEGTACDMLLTEYVGCAAVLAYRNLNSPRSLLEAVAQLRAPPKIARSAQYLEAAFNGAPDIEMVLLRASDWLQSQVGFVLVDGQVDTALLALRAALEMPTPRKRVAQFLAEKPAQPVLADWWPLGGNQLELLMTGASHGYGVVDLRVIGACKLCGQSLKVDVKGVRTPEPSMLAQLKLCCVAPCPKCHKPLINSAAVPQ